MKRLGAVGLVAAVIAGIGTAAFVLRADDGTTEAIGTAADALVAGGVPAVLVRVRDGNEQPVELQRGDASVGDRFRVGSVTKTFVAAAALMLADEGRLSLDDPVDRHVLGLLRDGDRVVVRDLLDHTAGLFDYTSVRELREGDRSPRALVDLTNTQDRNPGAYSSTNYLALGLVLEAASGRSLGDLLEDVFTRFGLEGTSFDPGRVRGPYLHGHERALRDGIATGRLRDTAARTARSTWAAGAVVSTAADLERFFTRLLASELGRRMTPVRASRFGLGLVRFETECGTAVGHTGNVLGTVTVVWARGGRVLVAAANVFPLTPDQEAAFQRLLVRAFCG